MILRVAFFLLSLAGAAYGGYTLAGPAHPQLTLVAVKTCSPAITLGYVLIAKDGYVGSVRYPLDAETVDAYKALQQAGKLRAGELRFVSPFQCLAL